ncbi:lytic transglycosylase domain-containing protein [Falsigemmobacter faecalis]|uniref:lytic transglycosylase domain-containing protein n=1 Tax=Falsigemmobacter faecalis TaxID=2488730 RepID=UPI002D7881A2|nr:lytic transglycosylase domain-containing protein [Falsigemmobacter faecalis]
MPGSLFLFEQNDRSADKADPVPADRDHAPAPAAEVLQAIEATALRYAGHGALKAAGLTLSDWMLFYRANIEVESRYQLQALSPAGAIGPGQLMPATAADLGVDPYDWRQNLDGSARYLLQMLALFGTTELALAGYNAGPEAVRRHGGIPPYPETRSHLARVAQVVARLKGEV